MHYATGLGDALVRRPVGMVNCDIRRHRVGKALDDAWDNEQEEPELQICPLDAKHPEHVPPVTPPRGEKLELHAPTHRRKRHRGIRPRHEADQVEQWNKKEQQRRDYRHGGNEHKNEHRADEGPILPFAKRIPCLAAIVPCALHGAIRAPWG